MVLLPPMLRAGIGVAADSNRQMSARKSFRNVLKEICASSEQKIMIDMQNRSARNTRQPAAA
jgi:hypothetical protein